MKNESLYVWIHTNAQKYSFVRCFCEVRCHHLHHRMLVDVFMSSLALKRSHCHQVWDTEWQQNLHGDGLQKFSDAVGPHAQKESRVSRYWCPVVVLHPDCKRHGLLASAQFYPLLSPSQGHLPKRTRWNSRWKNSISSDSLL